MAAGGDKSGDFYAVLGLTKDCSNADLRNAYKKLVLRWHPDRCSSSGNSKFVEEAKEKFQEIQEAYSVLSDSNKRFLYDVGIYESDDDDNGMGDFLGEMAQMMSQTKPSENGQESFEELQKLFVEMFHADLDLGLGAGPQRPNKPINESNVQDCSTSSSNGVNKRCSSGKAKLDEFSFTSTSSEFCFGSNNTTESLKGINGGGEGSSSSKRRSGRKQKVSSRHDVSSRDAEIST
ncbi:dnaJ homolog subfamily B member 8-like isoform X1 [Dioscorea cayenensis subsp. rotundata]|uniref:DnaJ homolog subfamily B member 8-like isoform X1 n=1 Tax=Dioscorea cayennensis subsp. rotundata TaxID=55577 RepID=A0AB40AXS4_DIOCR|nr:dnaJ homolog subfamily B member 8-like isoform X1 [Dioscorea cayenensis subsp. rotundata]